MCGTTKEKAGSVARLAILRRNQSVAVSYAWEPPSLGEIPGNYPYGVNILVNHGHSIKNYRQEAIDLTC